jgi:aspartate/methionine/tyrosine aminotransferase
VLPLNGTRDGLFSVLFPFVPDSKAGARPIVAMPNPFYQVYAAGALACGAEPLYVPALAANGFLPDYASLPQDQLNRIAAVYVCSPSNPEGAVASRAYWDTLFDLAERHDFIVLVAGCANLIAKFRAFRNVAGPQVPTPILAASAACWRDENHVIAGRAAYQEKMAAAEALLGNRMKRPEGGFFLWLDVGNGEEFAARAWAKQGVRLLPGAYMGRESLPGKTQSNPGFSYARVALVNDLSTIMAALERLREIL